MVLIALVHDLCILFTLKIIIIDDTILTRLFIIQRLLFMLGLINFVLTLI